MGFTALSYTSEAILAVGAIVGVAVKKGYIGWPTPDGYLGKYLVRKTKVKITWTAPPDVNVEPGGFELTSAQLNAKTEPEVDVVYDLPLASRLPAGEHTLKVSLKDTGKYEAEPVEVTLKVKRLKPTIVWNEPEPCDYVEGGFKLTVDQLNADITPEAGELTYDRQPNTLLEPGDHTLKVTAKENEIYEAAEKSVTLKVRKKRVVINWAKPADVNYVDGGFVLTAAQLNATTSPEGVPLKYTPALNAKLNAGDHMLKVEAAEPEKYECTPVEVRLKVKRLNPEITWAQPAAVVANNNNGKFELTKTQLNAQRVKGQSPLVYSPALKSVVAAGSHRLEVSHAQSSNFHFGDKWVKLDVFKGEQEKEGFDLLRNGGNFKNNVLNQAVKNNWDNDTDQVKTKAKELMGLFQGMTGPGIKSHMEKMVQEGGITHFAQTTKFNGKVSDYPCDLYAMENGLQIRYKPKGDKHTNPHPQNNPNPVPMFCIEVLKPSNDPSWSGNKPPNYPSGISWSPNQVAAKISIGGELAPKGPGDTQSTLTTKDYTAGTCKATHFVCLKKRKQSIKVVKQHVTLNCGETLTQDHFGVSLQPGDGAVTLSTQSSPMLNLATKQSVTITAAATDQFDKSQITATVTVKKVKPKLTWSTPADLAWIEGGVTLSQQELIAKASPDAFTKDITYSMKKLDQAGEHTITASLASNDKREAAQDVSVVIYVRKATPTITWKTEIEVTEDGEGEGVVLDDKILNASISSKLQGEGLALAYSPPLGTRLAVGIYTLQVRSPEHANYKQVTATSTLTVKSAPN